MRRPKYVAKRRSMSWMRRRWLRKTIASIKDDSGKGAMFYCFSCGREVKRMVPRRTRRMRYPWRRWKWMGPQKSLGPPHVLTKAGVFRSKI